MASPWYIVLPGFSAVKLLSASNRYKGYGSMNIVFVHGIFDNGGLFRSMEKFFLSLGHSCHIPALKPADARHGIADLSGKLGSYIATTLPKDKSFVVVGFSMGCLVSRYYLQELGGHERCRAFYAVSGPHHGSLLSHLYVGQGAVDMRPGSEFLQKLENTQSVLKEMELHSYRTPFDQMIIPPKSSYWEIAENHEVKVFPHTFMLRSKSVMNHINQSLQKINASP